MKIVSHTLNYKGDTYMLLINIYAGDVPSTATNDGAFTCTQHMGRIMDDCFIYTKNVFNNNSFVKGVKEGFHYYDKAIGKYFFGSEREEIYHSQPQQPTMEGSLESAANTFDPSGHIRNHSQMS